MKTRNNMKQDTKLQEKLIVWQKSINFVEQVYKHTGNFPENELYGLTSQLRKTSMCVPVNIAQDTVTKTRKKTHSNYLAISRASLKEVNTLVAISLRLKYIDDASHVELTEGINHIGEMLNGLIKKR